MSFKKSPLSREEEEIKKFLFSLPFMKASEDWKMKQTGC